MDDSFLRYIEDRDFIENVYGIYEALMQQRDNADYVVNWPQAQKFYRVWKFFQEEADNTNGSYLDPLYLQPKEEHGGLTATFLVFDISGERIKTFSEIIGYTSAVSMDATDDGRVCISVTVPNVFVPKDKA